MSPDHLSWTWLCCSQLHTALHGTARLTLLRVIPFLTWLKSFTPCCRSLFILSFVFRGGGTILILNHSNVVMGNWFQKGSFSSTLSLFPTDVCLHRLCSSPCSCSSAITNQLKAVGATHTCTEQELKTSPSETYRKLFVYLTASVCSLRNSVA